MQKLTFFLELVIILYLNELVGLLDKIKVQREDYLIDQDCILILQKKQYSKLNRIKYITCHSDSWKSEEIIIKTMSNLIWSWSNYFSPAPGKVVLDLLWIGIFLSERNVTYLKNMAILI